MENVRIATQRFRVDLNNPFFLGFYSAIFQIILFRNYLFLFKANEFYITIFFSMYFLGFLLLGFAVKKINFRFNDYFVLYFFSLILFLFFLTIIKSLIIASIILILIGGITGFYYIHFTKIYPLPFVYRNELLGAIIGYLLIFIGYFFSLHDLIIIAILGITAILISRKILHLGIILVLFLIYLFVFNMFIIGKYKDYKYKIFNSPSGRFVIYEKKKTTVVSKNGKALFISDNKYENEKQYFLPLFFLNKKCKEAIFVGEMPSYIEKILKRNGINYIKVWDYFIYKNRFSRISTINKLLMQTDKKYDMINLGFVDLESLHSIRNFSDYFIKLLSDHQPKQGILVFSIYGEENFLNITYYKMLYTILKKYLKYYKDFFVIPGNNLVFIFSNDKIYINYSRWIKNFNQYHLNYLKVYEIYTLDRAIELTRELKKSLKSFSENDDIYLLSYQFFSHFPIKKYFPYTMGIFIFIILLFYFLSGKQWLFMQGCDNMLLQIIFLLQFEIYYGNLYLYTTLFSLFLMLGLWIGNYILEKYKLNYKIPVFGKILFLIGSIILIRILHNFIFFYVMIFLLGILSGSEFYTLSYGKRANISIISDYLGAFLMTLLGGLILLPILGATKTLILLLLLRLFFSFQPSHN